MIYDYEFWCDLAPWQKYHSDIIVEVVHNLTEPTCPNATVKFETPEHPIKYISQSFGDTIEEAVDLACVEAIRRLTEWKDMTLDEIVEYREALFKARFQELKGTIDSINFDDGEEDDLG